MYYVTIKKINTEHERKNSISQAIIPYSLIFLVFCSRVESFLAGVSAGREGRRQTNETLLTTDIFTPPGDYISSKYMSASEVLRYPCMHLCNYIKPPTSSFFVHLRLALGTTQTLVIQDFKFRYIASSNIGNKVGRVVVHF